MHRTRIVGIVLATALTTTAFPAVARSVADFARNAHKVDGFHAVDPETARAKRAGKLVATDSAGRLPNSIIQTAPDSRLLGGQSPAFYEASPCKAGIAAQAFVPADVSEGADVGTAFTNFLTDSGGGGGVQPTYECRLADVIVERRQVGLYQLSFGGQAQCLGENPPFQLIALVTPKSATPSGLVANSWTKCDSSRRLLEEVRITTSDGTPVDGAFSFMWLGSLPIPPK